MKILAIILFGGGIIWSASAQNNFATSSSTNVVLISSSFVNELLEEARTNNPALRAANSRVTVATLGADSVRTWDDPTAMLGGSLYSDRGFDPSQEGDLAYGVEQKLPLWGRPKLTRRIAQGEVGVRQAESAMRVQEVRRDLTKSLLTTAFAERVVEIGEQDLAWLDTISKATENKYRTGDAAIADTLQIQNEFARRNDALRTDRNRLGHEHVALNRLLNRPADAPWPSLQSPAVGVAIPLSQKLLTRALDNEPKLKVMEQEIQQARATTDLTRKARLPDVSLAVEGRQFSGDGDFRQGDFTLRFSLPWFNEGKYHKDYERDRERQNTIEQEREDQVLMVREQLDHLAVDLEDTRREALLYQDEITPRSTQALASRQADWENGHSGLRDVLEARRMLLESELMSARATTEHHEMLAELLLWTGADNFEALAPLANEPALLHH